MLTFIKEDLRELLEIDCNKFDDKKKTELLRLFDQEMQRGDLEGFIIQANFFETTLNASSQDAVKLTLKVDGFVLHYSF